MIKYIYIYKSSYILKRNAATQMKYKTELHFYILGLYFDQKYTQLFRKNNSIIRWSKTAIALFYYQDVIVFTLAKAVFELVEAVTKRNINVITSNQRFNDPVDA